MACNSLWRSSWRCSVWSPSPSSASAPSCSTRWYELLRKGFFCQHHHCSTSTASATWAPSATSAPATEELESARKKCRGESLYLPTGYKERIKITWGTNWLLKLETPQVQWAARELSTSHSASFSSHPSQVGWAFFNVYKNANKFLWEGKKTFLLNTPNTDQVINRNQNQEGWISV